MPARPVKLGIAGAGGRAGSYADPVERDDRVEVTAVCDVFDESLEDAREAFDASETYVDYDAMLWEADLDAVIVGTPKQYHVAHAVAALERGLDVLCEVPAGVSLGECRELVRAAAAADGTYAMAENYVYLPHVATVAAMVDDGRFGELYYAATERLNNEVAFMERTKWRRTWRGGRNGLTYPTHAVGPLLRWLGGDRIARVACLGSGHHHVDPRGDRYEQADTVELVAETDDDRLVRIRQDVLSDRPPAPYVYHLQGTDGSFEGSRADDDPHRVWLSDLEGSDTPREYRWRDLEAFEEEYLPDRIAALPERAREGPFGGADYLILEDFVDTVADGAPPTVGIHEALDVTLPGVASERSISNGGEWVEVPDSREWYSSR